MPALSRSFRLRDGLRIETRVAATNLLDRANFALPNRFLGVEVFGRHQSHRYSGAASATDRPRGVVGQCVITPR